MSESERKIVEINESIARLYIEIGELEEKRRSLWIQQEAEEFRAFIENGGEMFACPPSNTVQAGITTLKDQNYRTLQALRAEYRPAGCSRTWRVTMRLSDRAILTYLPPNTVTLPGLDDLFDQLWALAEYKEGS